MTTENSNSFQDETSNAILTSPVKAGLDSSVNTSSATPAPIPILTTATSWNQAHDIYCTKQWTLKATIQQVLNETCEENQELPWELPRRSNFDALVEANEVAKFLGTKRGKSSIDTAAATPQKSSASSWLMSPLKVVSAMASIMRDPDDDVDEWVQEGDDAFIDDGNYNAETSSSSSTALGLNTPIVNLDLTESAIQSLENEILRLPPYIPRVMGVSEWNVWAHSIISKHDTTNNRLSVHDIDFLLKVLVGLNKARIINRQNQKPQGLDVVVLSSTTMTADANDCIPENLRIPVSLWDIQNAEEQIEQKLEEWSEQAAACTKKALEYKKRNQVKLATTQLAKRRVIQQRIDSDSRLQMQLLQTKNAIESAQSNRSMVDLMAGSAKLLRQLREETPIEEIDEKMDDLQSELDDLQDVNDTLSSLGGNVANMGKDEEEELMKELESLSINDNTIVAQTVAEPTENTIEEPTIELPQNKQGDEKKNGSNEIESETSQSPVNNAETLLELA